MLSIRSFLGNFGPPATVAVHRDAIDSIRAFDTSFRVAQDNSYSIYRLAANSHVVLVRTSLVHRRIVLKSLPASKRAMSRKPLIAMLS